MLNFLEINRDTIIKEGNPILREKSIDVEFPLSDATKSLIKRMEKYLIESNDEQLSEQKNLEPAVGIAAPQVGNNLNIFLLLYEDENDKIYVEKYINPKIIKRSKELSYLSNGEGCLSIPEKREGYVHRNAEIEVEYYDEEGNKYHEKFKEFYAIAFQHEFDHLQGVLYFDYINQEEPFAIKEQAREL
ncbi:MAG: peptide deformylase [Mycoplasmatales bacterium]